MHFSTGKKRMRRGKEGGKTGRVWEDVQRFGGVERGGGCGLVG